MSYTFTDAQEALLLTVGPNSTKKVLRGLFEALDCTYLTSEKQTYEKFESVPICSSKAGGAPTGTAGDENLMLCERNMFEYHIITGQTILVPTQLATGLNVAFDQAASDGLEITQGILSNSRMCFTVGTHAFYARLKFLMSDVSDVGDAAFGFRKAEDYQADIDDYDEMACMNCQAGQIEIHTIDNGDGTVETDTTETDWVDGAAHEFEVHVDIDGVVTFLYDGAAPEKTKALTFDDAEKVIPFFYFKLTGDGTSTIVLQEWEVGEEE